MFMLHPSRILLCYIFLYLLVIAVTMGWGGPAIATIYCWPFLILTIFLWRKSFLRYFLLAIFVIIFAFGQINSLDTLLDAPRDTSNMAIVSAEPKLAGYSQNIILNLADGGRVSVFVPTYPEYQIGDKVQITGAITPASKDPYYLTNPGYFKVRGINFVSQKPQVALLESSNKEGNNLPLHIRRQMVNVRKKYEEVLKKILPEPYAGLSIGILLGSKSELSDDLNNLFIALGIIHIMALSGYNITIIADNLRPIAKPISVNFAFYFALLGIWSFVLATGLSASVVRAAIMGSLLLLARRLGRQADAFVAIMIAAVIMVAINPYILLYDLGFQLSFAAMCGLVFLAPWLTKIFSAMGKTLSEIMGTTVAAQIFTIPLICYYFGRVSLVSVLANLLILPFIPLIMCLIFVTASIGLVSIWLSQKVSFFLWLALGYVLQISEILGSVPGIEREFKIGPLALVGSYVLLIEVLIVLRKKSTGANEEY